MPRKDLFELCELCVGAGALPPDSQIYASAPRALTRRDDGQIICPSCGGRRFIATGLSVGQVEGIIRERDELKARVAELEGRH